MKVTHSEAQQIFDDHTKFGAAEVFIPKESNLEVIEYMKQHAAEMDHGMGL